MAQVDYYQLLGVNPTATLDEIRKAYRRLARRVHPDTNPGWEDDTEANRQMAALNEAYAVLRDAARRAEYDRQRRCQLDEMMRRARSYEQAHAQTRYTYAYAGRRSHQPRGGWSQLAFRPSVDQQVMWILIAIVLAVVGVYGIRAAVDGMAVLGTLIMLGGFMGGALSGMAAIPYFQGYVVLTKEALIEYPAFGLFPARVYRYDEICDVHLRVQHHKYGTTVRILIDYFQRDPAGRLNVNYYHSKWLMLIGDPRTLFYILRRQASARKFAFTKPTWWAVVVGARELIGLMVAAFGVMVVMVFWGCGSA
jgi:hypothetical protein